MKRPLSHPATADLICDSCGQLPEPGKTRVTLANVAVMLPIELLVHAAVVNTDLPYLAKVLVLAVTATALVIWVADPAAARLLRPFLHAPAIRRRRRLDTAATLWRARVLVRDEPGALERITRRLARLDINILSIHVHPAELGTLDEFVLSAPGGLREDDILEALQDGGGRAPSIWPTTALALADGQTKALTLAARLTRDPGELRHVVAELLSAEVVHPCELVPSSSADGTTLKIPTAWHGPLVFRRPAEPFTLAESARAHRLAEIAESVERQPVGEI